MLRTYHWKMFYGILFIAQKRLSLYHKGWQFSCHLPTGINVKDVSLEMFYGILFIAQKRLSLYHKGWQFSCHLPTGINVKDVSLENVLRHFVYCTKISVRLYHKGWQFS